jgi:hypothetical protein
MRPNTVTSHRLAHSAAALLAAGLALLLLYGLLGALRPRAATSAAASPAPQPQSAGLVERVEGYVLLTEPVGGIAAVQLPSGRKSYVRRPAAQPGAGPMPVHALAGPDSAGRVVYLEQGIAPKVHRLGVVKLDGTGARLLFSRPGDALWDRKVGARLALSAAGGKVAFVSNLRPRQMRRPDAYLLEGVIEVWDVETGRGRQFNVAALDDNLAWLPDGRHLAYTKLVRREDVPALPLTPDNFGAWIAGWSRVPAVHVLDTDTGQERLLYVGQRAVAAHDGSAVVVADTPAGAATANYRSVRIDGGGSAAVKVPGGAPVAVLAPDLYLALGTPGQGVAPRQTANNSPLVGPKPMIALNVAVPDTDRLQTAVADIDPRWSVSFGRTPPPATSPAARGGD